MRRFALCLALATVGCAHEPENYTPTRYFGRLETGAEVLAYAPKADGVFSFETPTGQGYHSLPVGTRLRVVSDDGDIGLDGDRNVRLLALEGEMAGKVLYIARRSVK